MRSSKPPALATWLVEHAVRGGNSEALAGDLLEQFSQGRSAGWYWRQVVSAIIVGWSKEFRTLGVAVGVTVVWTSALTLFYGRFWADAQMIALERMVLRHGWWDWGGAGFSNWCFSSLGIAAFNALPIALATSIYLGLARTFTVRRFLRGFVAGLLATAISFGLSFVPLSLFGSFDQPLGLLPRSLAELVLSLFLLFILLISMWAAGPNQDGHRKLQVALP
jgi:hypothetical protein